MADEGGRGGRGRAEPLRVGFVIDALAPGAGTENQLLLLLRGFDPSRLQAFLCCLRGESPSHLLPGIPVETVGVVHLASPSGARGLGRVRSWVRERRLHGVTTFFRDGNIVGTLAARWAGVPVVSTRRNLGYWHNSRELAVLRVLNRMTQRFVANSEAVRRRVIESEGLDPRRIDVIPNAVDTTRFRPGREGEKRKIRKRLGIAADAFVVGCVANLRPVKGHPDLMIAFSKVKRSVPAAELVLVGEGSEETRLRSLALDLGIQKSVHFLGARTDTAEVLRGFDIMVLPSLSEGLSNALLEAMASSLACVATDVGGNRELLQDVGRLVPPADVGALAEEMQLLASEERLRRDLGQAARSHVITRFAPSAVLELWYGLYEEHLRRL